MTDRPLQWLSITLLIALVALATAGALRWDVLKLWWRSLFTPRQEPHLHLQDAPERHRHTHHHPDEH